MHKIIRASEAVVRQITHNKTANNLITKHISPEVSLAITQSTSNEYHEREIAHYNRIYYVLSGELKIVADDEVSVLQKGDACFLKQDTEYEMSGKFEAITINQPAFGTYE